MNASDLIRHLDYSVLLPSIARLPVRLAYRMADVRGDLFHRYAADSRIHAERSVARVFPELTAAEAQNIVRKNFRVISRDAMETFWYTRPPAFFEKITEISGLEELSKATNAGRGVLLFSGHFGNIGLFFVALGKKGIAMNIIGRSIDPADNPLHPAELRYNRKRVHRIESTVRRPFILTGRGNYPVMREKLRQGEIVMLLIDVAPYLLKKTVPVSFLGGQTLFGFGLSSLHRETGAPIFQWSIRSDDRNHIEIEEVTEQVRNLDSDEEVMQRLAGLLERKIRLYPDQWNQWDSLDHFHKT